MLQDGADIRVTLRDSQAQPTDQPSTRLHLAKMAASDRSLGQPHATERERDIKMQTCDNCLPFLAFTPSPLHSPSIPCPNRLLLSVVWFILFITRHVKNEMKVSKARRALPPSLVATDFPFKQWASHGCCSRTNERFVRAPRGDPAQAAVDTTGERGLVVAVACIDGENTCLKGGSS